MFKQENRLRKEHDVKHVLFKGKSVYDPACGVKFAKNTLGTSRFAIVVGTKVHKGAVRRNKIRRQYREIIKKYLDLLKPGYDVVLLTSKPALELEFSEKEERLVKVLRKAGLFV